MTKFVFVFLVRCRHHILISSYLVNSVLAPVSPQRYGCICLCIDIINNYMCHILMLVYGYKCINIVIVMYNTSLNVFVKYMRSNYLCHVVRVTMWMNINMIACGCDVRLHLYVRLYLFWCICFKAFVLTVYNKSPVHITTHVICENSWLRHLFSCFSLQFSKVK